MAKKLQINQMRLSLISFETNTQLLGDPHPPKVPLGFLGNRDSYAAAFDNAQVKKPVPMGLKPPWDKEGQHFWEYYVEQKPPLPQVPGTKAWRLLVPFRGEVPVDEVKIPSAANEAKCVLESFFYPFGFGCVTTITIVKPLSLGDALDLMYEIRRDGKLDVTWQSAVQEQLPFKAFAAKCLTALGETAFGPAHKTGASLVEPFTVFTVLKASGKASDKQIQGALEATTAWPPLWRKANLPPLDDKVKLELRSAASSSDIVYAQKRGRAVWFPDLFSDTKKLRGSLACYHRNLVLTSLQTESLCGFASATVQEATATGWSSLRVMHSDCAKLAAGILGRLYGGALDTYRSMSPRYYIQQNKVQGDVDWIRDKAGMTNLK